MAAHNGIVSLKNHPGEDCVRERPLSCLRTRAIPVACSTPILPRSNTAVCRRFWSGGLSSMMKDVGFFSLHSQPEPIKREVENGRGIEGQELAHDEAADNANTKWPAQF